VFVTFCMRVTKSRGLRGLQIYLKACTVLLQNAVAGRKLNGHAFGVAVSVTKTGFPRVIPPEHRLYIREGRKSYFRMWLTFFMLYRVIDIKAKVNVDALLAPWDGCPNVRTEWVEWLPAFKRLLLKRSRLARDWKVSDQSEDDGYLRKAPLAPVFRPLMSSGPNSIMGVPSMATVFHDAISITKPDFKEVFYAYCDAIRAGSVFSRIVRNTAMRPRDDLQWRGETWGEGYGSIGRLSFKYEPGKVRIFAIVDFWTQTVLRGLHQTVFGLLSSLNVGDERIDGTFDQVASFIYAKDRGRVYWSYDLSSATDRFPVWAQSSLIEEIFGGGLGTAWEELMCGRDFHVPCVRPGRAVGKFSNFLTQDYKVVLGSVPVKRLRYAVGQPMGAHSSWGVFALAHHALVQWAANRCGYKEWFVEYVLLGDDVVIFNRSVAYEYRRLVKRLGVVISPTKSLVQAQGVFEFAKKLAFKGDDWSPISFREFAISNRSLSIAMEMVNRCALHADLRLASVLRAFGFGYRSTALLSKDLMRLKGRRLRRYIVSLLHPTSVLGVKHWDAWLGVVRPYVFTTVGDDVRDDVATYLRDYFRDRVSSAMIPFVPLMERVEFLRQKFVMGPRLREGSWGTAPPFVELAVLRAVVERLREVEVGLLAPFEGSLADEYNHWRGVLEELEALRPIRDLFERPKPEDPQFLFSELKLWETLSRLVVRQRLVYKKLSTLAMNSFKLRELRKPSGED